MAGGGQAHRRRRRQQQQRQQQHLAEQHEAAGELFLAAKRFANAGATDELLSLGAGAHLSDSGHNPTSLMIRASELLERCTEISQESTETRTLGR